MVEREGAKRTVEREREHVKEIAGELRRRASSDYVKASAKEMVVEKSNEMKDFVLTSPLALGIIGGVTTATIASLFARYERSSQARGGGRRGFERRRGTGEMPGKGVAEKIEEKFGEVKESVGAAVEKTREMAGEAAAKVSEKAAEARERMPSVQEVRERVTGAVERTMYEQPFGALLGAVALGSALGFLLPMSRSERELIEPVRRRARQELESIGEKLEETIGEAGEKAEAQISREGAEVESTPPSLH